ncbi:MAG: hypothetical protein JWR21_2218 [Herminiimonas sp.]|nr:hypothetical protein [Herminiimonas sp.]MDB5852924.1 hypothetical protein [Herminiimonas sp.]
MNALPYASTAARETATYWPVLSAAQIAEYLVVRRHTAVASGMTGVVPRMTQRSAWVI